jgi:DNA-directed RNA polymerase subunit RPC12/RpoP
MGSQVEIKCMCCGRPRMVEPKTIYAYICSDCTKKLEQELKEKNYKLQISSLQPFNDK